MPIKFTPIKFPLKMRGVDIRNLDDLRKNFDLNVAIEYFKDGRLLKWLEVRYYDDEAEKVAALDENMPDFCEKLCDALGAEFDGENYLARLEEKKNRLRELTDDKSIIDNAADTAFDQEDLSELLDAGTQTIYLCGEKFSVPIRVRDKSYIGILAAPTIKIRANSQADLDEKNIRFENVILPWDIADVEDSTEKVYQPVNATANDSCMKELRDTFEVIFGTCDIWGIVDEQGKILSDEPTPAQKKIFIKTICGSTYTERDLIHLRAASDFSAGWALTKDALCVGGKISMEHNEPIDFRTYDDWRSDIIWNEGGDTTSELLAKIEQVRNQQKKSCFRYADMETITLIDSMMFVDELSNHMSGEKSYYSHGEESSIAANFTITDREKNSWVIWRKIFDKHEQLVFNYKDGNNFSAVEIFRGQSGNFKLKDGDELFSRKIKAQLVKFLELVKD